MRSRTRYSGPVSMAAALVVGVMGFSLSAQTPPAAPPAPAAPAAAPAAPAAPGRGQVAPAPGAPAGRGRGGPEMLPGGPQLADPAYAEYDFSKRAPLLPLTPEQQLAKFVLQPGYRLEPVLTDPIIEEPSSVYFDGNGRMYVLEIRGYMQDADATGQLDPVGRISRHVDSNGDGVYDQHTIFADNLIFPRFATPFGPNTLIVKESNSQDVWKYTDTNGDGVSDRKELFDTGYGRLGNVEHQESHLTWGLDNWMYSTFNSFRARWTPHGIIKEPIGNGGAQWGVVQDNDGKIWYQGGASGLPGYWQFPIVYGNFGGGRGAAAVGGIAPMDPDLSIPWGAPVRIADMQGGLSATRMPDGSLRGTTAGAGNDIVRGHRMPADLQGDYLYGEVVARIVRRVRPANQQGITTIKNAYDGNEFIKSTDPYFRPVDMTTAPDGTVYITDMYRGIIQEATWSGPGTYLRARIQQYDLDKVVRKGRIWRLVYDGVRADRSDALPRDTTMPRMNDETPAQLLAHLGHPNGWWRDTAQQLLVLKQDKSVVPALQERLRTSTNLLEKFHTLWTLEGLDALDAATVRREMAHAEPRMRIQAVRASETLYKGGDRTFAADYRRMAADPDVNVSIQALLTMNKWRVPDAAAVIKATAAANTAAGVQLVATTIFNPPANAGGGGPGRGGAPVFTTAERAVLDRGQQIYGELCFACHGEDGYGAPRPGDTTGATMAPRLVGSPRVNGHRDYVIKAVLHGVTGPVDGETFQEVMIPNQANPDEWVAAITSYVRNSFGNSGGFVTPADVARVRAATSARRTMWTVPELEASLPTLLINDGSWKVTASHNAPGAPNGLSMTTWNSQAGQVPGMWFQVELPQVSAVSELQFTSTAAGGRGGGGGRGAAGPPPVVGYPRGFKIETSTNGTTWTTAAEGRGEGAATVVAFRPVQAKFVRITQTAAEEGAPVWTIQQMRLFGAARAAAR